MRSQRLAVSVLSGTLVIGSTTFAGASSALAAPVATHAQRCAAANLSSFGSGEPNADAVAVGPGCAVWAAGSSASGPTIFHWSGQSWSHAATPRVQEGSLAGITASSAAGTWAVGDSFNGTKIQTLIFRLTSRGWRKVTSPDPAAGKSGNYLNAVAASGPDAFAVGASLNSSGGSQALIVRWNGKRWYAVPSPQIPDSVLTVLAAVAMTSPSNGWAVGQSDTGTSPQTLIEHWNGKHWSVASSPVLTGSLAGLAVLSPKNAWAVGYTQATGGNAALIEHWNGKRWSIVADPNMNVYKATATGSYLTAVAAISPSDLMISGYVAAGTASLPVVLRWNGAHLTAASTPNPAPPGAVTNLTAIAGSAATGFWITGSYSTSTPPIRSFAVHRPAV